MLTINNADGGVQHSRKTASGSLLVALRAGMKLASSAIPAIALAPRETRMGHRTKSVEHDINRRGHEQEIKFRR